MWDILWGQREREKCWADNAWRAKRTKYWAWPALKIRGCRDFWLFWHSVSGPSGLLNLCCDLPHEEKGNRVSSDPYQGTIPIILLTWQAFVCRVGRASLGAQGQGVADESRDKPGHKKKTHALCNWIEVSSVSRLIWSLGNVSLLFIRRPLSASQILAVQQPFKLNKPCFK